MYPEKIRSYVKENKDLMYSLLKQLCAITAPSGDEGRRAEFCKRWFDNEGFAGTYIDDALNVVLPFNCEGSQDVTVLVAHTDTVFPDVEAMPYREEGNIACCPGIGDDTACLVAMMLTAKFFKENCLEPEGGILFVANSGEEGLGNLKGTRQIFKDYAGRIKQFISFDSNINVIADRCVGSHRYEVVVRTEGGHSYLAFGKENAISNLAAIVKEIYSISLPELEGSRVTYNVGIIEGGTSVNTIAQEARMLCEYRSDNSELLDYMQSKFAAIFEGARKEGVDVEVRLVGDRPCAKGVDWGRISDMRSACSEIIKGVFGECPICESSSTDCNIPLSLGIPAICVGTFIGGGMHTREEWLDKDSMIPGLEIAIREILALTETEI